MKPKKITKKLSFSKSTIADLNSKDLNSVRGGTLPPTFSCVYTCYGTCDGMSCFHRPGTTCVG